MRSGSKSLRFNAYITLLNQAGAHAKENQVLARHSSPNLTMNTHARTTDGELHEIVETIDESVHQKRATPSGSAERKSATPVDTGGCASTYMAPAL